MSNDKLDIEIQKLLTERIPPSWRDFSLCIKGRAEAQNQTSPAGCIPPSIILEKARVVFDSLPNPGAALTAVRTELEDLAAGGTNFYTTNANIKTRAAKLMKELVAFVVSTYSTTDRALADYIAPGQSMYTVQGGTTKSKLSWLLRMYLRVLCYMTWHEPASSASAVAADRATDLAALSSTDSGVCAECSDTPDASSLHAMPGGDDDGAPADHSDLDNTQRGRRAPRKKKKKGSKSWTHRKNKKKMCAPQVANDKGAPSNTDGHPAVGTTSTTNGPTVADMLQFTTMGAEIGSSLWYHPGHLEIQQDVAALDQHGHVPEYTASKSEWAYITMDDFMQTDENSSSTAGFVPMDTM